MKLADREKLRHRCSLCGWPQYNTPAGVTCQNGHGGADELVKEKKVRKKTPETLWQKPPNGEVGGTKLESIVPREGGTLTRAQRATLRRLQASGEVTHRWGDKWSYADAIDALEAHAARREALKAGV